MSWGWWLISLVILKHQRDVFASSLCHSFVRKWQCSCPLLTSPLPPGPFNLWSPLGSLWFVTAAGDAGAAALWAPSALPQHTAKTGEPPDSFKSIFAGENDTVEEFQLSIRQNFQKEGTLASQQVTKTNRWERNLLCPSVPAKWV